MTKYQEKLNIIYDSYFNLCEFLYENYLYIKDYRYNPAEKINSNHILYIIEQNISELFIRISLDSINIIFSLTTILLVLIRILSDHNHENEYNSLYKILWFSSICLVVCFITTDLFWFYLGFKSITIPIYYLIHMYSSNIDKFRACDWYALFSFFSRAVLSFAVAMLANLYRTTNVNVLIYLIESIELNQMFFWHMHYTYMALILAFMIKSPVVPFHM